MPSMSRLFILMLFLLCSSAAGANCRPHAFNYPTTLRIDDPAVFVVTHASSGFDARMATKRGVDEGAAYARRNGIPVVYLEDTDNPENYFADDCSPDYRVYSEGGELPIDIHSSEVYVAGGHLEICLSLTLHDILLAWARHPLPRQRMTFLMDGIYSNGKYIQDGDPYHDAFWRFINVVTYGRPGGESWPKGTLLETLGVIIDPRLQYEYLQRALPHYERTLPAAYRVELQLNDEPPHVLRKGEGRNPPVFQFRFVDSAMELEDNANPRAVKSNPGS